MTRPYGINGASQMGTEQVLGPAGCYPVEKLVLEVDESDHRIMPARRRCSAAFAGWLRRS